MTNDTPSAQGPPPPRPLRIPFWFGIRARLLALVLLAIAPLLGLIVVGARQQVERERAAVLERAQVRARFIAARIDDQIGNIDALLIGLSHVVQLDRAAIDQNEAAFKAIMQDLPPFILNVKAQTLDGGALGSTSGNREINVADRSYFRAAIAGRGLVIDEPLISRSKDRWSLTLARPLFDPAGQVAGMVGVSFDLIKLHELLNADALPPGSVITILNQKATILARSTEPEKWIGRSGADNPTIRTALKAREGSTEFTAPDGSRRLAGFSTCTRAPWLVYARVPNTAAFAEVERQFQRTSLFCLVALAASLGLAWLMAGRIVRPLRRLSADAATLGTGGKPFRTQVAARSEVGILARSFNQMLANLEERDAELRRLNESLRLRVAELQTLLDLMPIGVGIAVDASGSDIRMNRALAFLLGLPPEANASLTAPHSEAPRNYRVLHQGRELRGEELPIQRALAENVEITDFEHTILRADGVEVPVLLNAVPLRDDAGRVRGCVATFQDLTARKQGENERLQFERRLLETQKLESLGVLAGGIAHDFNNLLTGILGHASLASLELPLAAPVQDNLTGIREGAVRAADLCRQMLAYSGKGRFVVQKLDLNRFVEETTQLLKISISKRAVLRFHLQSGLPPIEADVSQLRQVIMNLVINASEAIGEKSGVIGVSTGLSRVDHGYLGGTLLAPELPEGNYVHLEVSDNGCGMSPETQAKIFEPFFTTKFSGRGLGLAAVLGIVRGHKGAIKVYSEVGRGTTFKLLFPPAAGAADAGAPIGAARSVWRGQGCVLVVDDEESVRAAAAPMLRRLGFEVALAADGRAALDAFRADPNRYSLVLLDLTMPHLDGEQTFTELRRLRPDVRVVLMSGFSEQDAVARFTGKGLAAFLQKPFTLEALSAELQRIMNPGAEPAGKPTAQP